MTSAHVYAASRTPFGRFGGALVLENESTR
jgi:hypothetical protein